MLRLVALNLGREILELATEPGDLCERLLIKRGLEVLQGEREVEDVLVAARTLAERAPHDRARGRRAIERDRLPGRPS